MRYTEFFDGQPLLVPENGSRMVQKSITVPCENCGITSKARLTVTINAGDKFPTIAVTNRLHTDHRGINWGVIKKCVSEGGPRITVTAE